VGEVHIIHTSDGDFPDAYTEYVDICRRCAPHRYNLDEFDEHSMGCKRLATKKRGSNGEGRSK